MSELTRRRLLETGGLGLAGFALGCGPQTLDGTPLDTTAWASPQPGHQQGPGLTLAVDPFIEGELTYLSVSGMAPGDQAYFVRGRQLGPGPCPAPLAGECLSLSPANLLGTATADANGRAILPLVVPPGHVGQRVLLQAAVPGFGQPSQLTSVVAATVEAPGSVPSHVCEATRPSGEGPFYLPNAPIKTEFDLHGDVGTSLDLRGRIRFETCTPARRDAVVEIWHADPAGAYDNGSSYRYRGTVAVDSDGAFAIHTLFPGYYLNGASYRPAHFHVKIWVDGVERLTTQLYFENDPYFGVDSLWLPELIMPVQTLPGGGLEVQFEFVV